MEPAAGWVGMIKKASVRRFGLLVWWLHNSETIKWVNCLVCKLDFNKVFTPDKKKQGVEIEGMANKYIFEVQHH